MMFMREPRLPADLAFGVSSDDIVIEENGEPLRAMTANIEDDPTLVNIRSSYKVPIIGLLIKTNIYSSLVTIGTELDLHLVRNNPDVEFYAEIITALFAKHELDILYISSAEGPHETPIIEGIIRVPCYPYHVSGHKLVVCYTKRYVTRPSLSPFAQ